MRVADWCIRLQDKSTNREKKMPAKMNCILCVLYILCEWARARAQSNIKYILWFNHQPTPHGNIYWFNANVSFSKSWLFTKCFSDLHWKKRIKLFIKNVQRKKKKEFLHWTLMQCTHKCTDEMKFYFNGWMQNFAISTFERCFFTTFIIMNNAY